MLNTKIKQKKLGNNSNISNLVKSSYLNTKISTLATKAEIKGKDKIMKLQTHDLSCFLGKNVFCDGFQDIFDYQPTPDTLELKKDEGTDYVLSWKSKGEHTSKHKSFYTAFLHSIKISGYRMGKKLIRTL